MAASGPVLVMGLSVAQPDIGPVDLALPAPLCRLGRRCQDPPNTPLTIRGMVTRRHAASRMRLPTTLRPS